MIRNVVICDQELCIAMYIPDTDLEQNVLDHKARLLGWKRLDSSNYSCPGCVIGKGPVLELGECTSCNGRTVDKENGAHCRHCNTVIPHSDSDFDEAAWNGRGIVNTLNGPVIGDGLF